MDILYFLHKFPKLSESFVINEILQLEKMGHNIIIFAAENPSEDVEHIEENIINSKTVYSKEISLNTTEKSFKHINKERMVNYRGINVSKNQKYQIADLSLKCLKYIQNLDEDFDIICTHFARFNRYPAVHISEYLDIPLVLTTHAFDIYQKSNSNALSRMLYSADTVITISEHNKRYLEDNYPYTNQIKVVKIGLDTNKFSSKIKTEENRILTVSRLVEKKGLDIALEAVSKIKENYPDLEYRIVGKGNQKDKLMKIIQEEGLEDTVQFLGNIDDGRLIKEYDKATCFLLPCKIAADGDKDGIPVSLMESMAMKTTPVSTNVSGIPELIDDGKNGFMVSCDSSHYLKNKLEILLNEKTKRVKMGENAREKVEQEFELENQTKKLEKLLKKIKN